MSAAALALHDVAKSFGGLRVLESVSLDVQPGERRAIIGPNGAGKTTLFHIMSGMVPPSGGRIELFGHDVTRDAIHRRVARGMARTFQITNLFPNLTVEQNVVMALQALRPSKFSMLRPVSSNASLLEEVGSLLTRWQMDGRRLSLVKELSYGEQRTLEILLAVCQRPKVLLLDEPTAGLSPAETAVAVGVVRELPRDMAIVLIEHDMDVAFQLCDFITVLHSGRVLASGTIDDVRANPNVKAVYLGK
jgi:branched-chain amino acid transport system ATP-binding protein